MSAHDDEAERAAADGGPRAYSTEEEIHFFVWRHERKDSQSHGFLGHGTDTLGVETLLIRLSPNG